MAIKIENLEKVAIKLLDTWKAVRPDLLLSIAPQPALMFALQYLMSMRGLSLSDSNHNKTAILDEIKEKITTFQKMFGLPETGILDRETWKKMTPGCPDCNDDGVKTDLNNPLSSLVQYFIHDSVIQTVGSFKTSELIANAWQFWVIATDSLVVRKVLSEDAANVVIKMDSIDGNGNVVGRAPQAGPGRLIDLTVLLDVNEAWTPSLFQGAACHEFGHILGLGHNENAGTLMSEVIPNGLSKPLEADIKLLQDIWGGNAEPFEPREGGPEM